MTKQLYRRHEVDVDQGQGARSALNYLFDLLGQAMGRIVNGLAGLVFAASCQSGEVAPVMPTPPVPHEVASSTVPPIEPGPRTVGQFNITFYYVIGEDEVIAKPALAPVPANDNETQLASINAEPERVTLYDGGSACEPISEVSKEFAAQLALQGTGKLHDGRVLNVWGTCKCGHSPCFKVTEAQWGTAGTGRALQPFRTVAVDPKVVKLGSLLYMPLLEGRLMPGRPPWGGFVHDGCVIADDTGGHIGGNRIDLFVGRKAYFLGLSGSGGSHAWARGVPVFDGSGICERKGRVIARRAAAI